ncbi:MAG: hypothetical protein PUK64_06755, partial [bacterium]|nr:hypothetical protein [bacterium]
HVQPGLVNGQLHHRIFPQPVAVVYILVSEADLENACHDDFRQTVSHEKGCTSVMYAACQPGGKSQTFLFLLKQQKTSMR